MEPIRQFAIGLGVLLALGGVLGYFDPLLMGRDPGIQGEHGLFLGILAVNNIHNLVHLVSGVLGIAAGLVSWAAARWYAIVFGIIYALVALVGLLNPQGTMVLGVLPLNLADTALHAAIAVASLYFGFSRQFGTRTT